ncbi:MAG TPA: DNA-directed RNA polymerase subunit beta, partial [Candidatus Paceibacterota bacterium]|nr:DNA-directed RNA polymerase subunit beta [Candidatus Paceibacterota bacterium]
MAKFSSVKNFSKSKPLIAPFNLNEAQLSSYQWFLDKGLREIFDEISPIRDHTGKEFELHFIGYRFDEPKHDEATARYKEATYEAPLRCTLRLVNKNTGREQEQEVYFGDFPIMTSRGTFIVNGVERVVVSQLVRSAGVYFTATPYRGRQLFGAKIIPNRGAWLEFETDQSGEIGVKIDRRRKVQVTDMLRIFGLENE